MKTITVDMAGRSYRVEGLPIRSAKVWRQHLEERMGGALVGLREISVLALKQYENPDELLKAATNTLLGQAAAVFTTLVRSSDLVAECVFDFAPTMAADRDWIEEHASDEEMTHAFIQVLGLVYPFGSWAELVRSLGLWATTMRKNSVVPSSESGQKNSTPKEELVS